MSEGALTTMQGVSVPAASVNPELFFAATRRETTPQRTFAYGGLGQTDNVPILQTGILFGVSVRFAGTLTVTLGGGTCATTAQWPYNLAKRVRLSANGQSNLINCSGWALKARDIMARGDMSDRGVSRGITGASPGTATTQGTLSLASENWGVGQAVTAIAGAPTVYNVDLEWYVPVAFDDVDLLGAIFAQTSSTDINLALDWATSAELFTLTGAATAVLAGSVVVEARTCSIPQGPDGNIVLPDLSAFHSLLESRYTALANGQNEVKLVGQGAGRQLLRVFHRINNNALWIAVNATNYGQLGWRYGGNTTPEVYTEGLHAAMLNERLFNSFMGGPEGYFCHDFAAENAFRDSVDEGAATELRLLVELPAGLALTTPYLEYVQETMFAGAVGA